MLCYLDLHCSVGLILLQLMPTPIFLFSSGVFVMIDNAVPPVPASMNDENLDEEESGGKGLWSEGRREGGPIILLSNSLKLEAHQSETTCSNDSCPAFIKV